MFIILVLVTHTGLTGLNIFWSSLVIRFVIIFNTPTYRDVLV